LPSTSKSTFFEGETGPYCQYAAVRANSIFRKLPDQAVGRPVELIRTAMRSRQAVEDSGDSRRVRLHRDLVAGNAASGSTKLLRNCGSAEPANLPSTRLALARLSTFSIIAPHQRRRECSAASSIDAAAIHPAQINFALETLGIGVPERM